ncbi:methionine-rich copper-binding protein CopC [Conyzicola lurida]|uniref:Methionine-rich copper-binding protein CopC n=1 Tax=Conyzicola lurida TaxID=1172621 RepID=A0A841APS4_9MICO|nr:copper resistance CopC family protein [Conyzicola lurida]MBB5843565.1 methionine-rich copper-binding protein CopC [Conyzicola lurida]
MAARRRIAVAGLSVAVAGVAVLGFAAPAQAHDVVVASTPAQGETLTALPEAFSLTMNETLVVSEGTEANFGIRITDAAGLFYGDGCLSFVDATMSTGAYLGAPGTYTVVWQFVSSDGHIVSSSGSGYSPISFTWQPAADAVATVGSATAPVCGVTEVGTATPSPDPTMSTQETPAETPSPSATAATEPSDADASTSSTLLWIGGAGLAVVAAVVVTLLLVRPKKLVDTERDDTERDDTEA